MLFPLEGSVSAAAAAVQQTGRVVVVMPKHNNQPAVE